MRKRSGYEETAGTLSLHTGKPWYVCKHPTRTDKVMQEADLKRFMQQGYTVSCVYYKGQRHSNIYTLSGKMYFVM